MAYNYLLIDVNDGVGTLTINRPKELNALNSAVLDELALALAQLQADEAVKVVILTGQDKKAFVAGADIKEMSEMGPCEAIAFSRKGQKVLLAVEAMTKPVIAAVNGYALGGGCELALACDFIYASENARFGFPEVTLGIMPGFGGTQNTARLIGAGRAKELVFSGRLLLAPKAQEWGIVNEVYPADELMAKVAKMAATIAANGLVGVAYAKDALVNGLNMTKEDGFRYESSLFGTLFATADQKEGMGAFLEKRKPAFTGK